MSAICLCQFLAATLAGCKNRPEVTNKLTSLFLF